MRLTMILPVTSLSGSCDKEKSGILGYSVQRKRSELEPKKKKKKNVKGYSWYRDIADKKKKKQKKKKKKKKKRFLTGQK